ncbi:MAG: phosphoribosyl-AMP cyclohydrolase [Planctomycetota bacterium]
MALTDLVTFDDAGLIPAIIVDAQSQEPLVLCYLDREALARTMETGYVHVYRRSKGRVMLKGETSGHTQRVIEVRVNCDANSLAIAVEQKVAACHTGYYSCYYRRYNPETDRLEPRAERIFDPDEVY